jgi:hypothetical protein
VAAYKTSKIWKVSVQAKTKDNSGIQPRASSEVVVMFDNKLSICKGPSEHPVVAVSTHVAKKMVTSDLLC